jgi:putative addiction module killer protein
MVEVVRTDEFDEWIRKLKDRAGRLRILKRIDRLAATGNPGDVKPVGNGVFELRLDVGPGYRVYYLQDGDVLILLLCGGDKSTQQKDIDKSHQLADEWRADMQKERGDEQHE